LRENPKPIKEGFQKLGYHYLDLGLSTIFKELN
jgi:hypothetical protein